MPVTSRALIAPKSRTIAASVWPSMYSIQMPTCVVVLIGAVDDDDVGVADAGEVTGFGERRVRGVMARWAAA